MITRNVFNIVTLVCALLCWLSYPLRTHAQGVVLPPQGPPWNGVQSTCGSTTPIPDTFSVRLTNYYSESGYGSPVNLTVYLEDYTLGATKGELGPVVPSGPYAGTIWTDQTIRAMAVAARTFGAYFCNKHAGAGYGLCDSGESACFDQEYRPYYPGFSSSTQQLFVDQVNGIQGVYLAYLVGQQGAVIDAQHRANTGNPTTSWYTSFNYKYLQSVSNPYNVGGSNGPGLSQTAMQGWVKNANQLASWWQILAHYYPGAHLMNKMPTMNMYLFNGYDATGCTLYQATQIVNKIDFDWGTNSPAPGVVPADGFCLQWVMSAPFVSDWYTFFVTADDGFRLRIDGALVLDKWFSQAPTMYAVSMPMSAGSHSITLDYFENSGGATARLSWLRGASSSIGSYYTGLICKTCENISNPLIMRRYDRNRFDWVNSSPLDITEPSNVNVPRIPTNNFSAVWRGNLYIPSCRTVNFNARVDDRIWFQITHAGGATEVLIDKFDSDQPGNYTFSRYLCPGTYPFQFRYYENTVYSTAYLGWN